MADATEAPAWVARNLLRAARAATLASSADGQPFASLVTPACAPDLSVLLLLSDLSEHTRHLRAEPRCAVMVVGEATDKNPQTAPRVTVTGLAEPVDDAGLKARWLAVHPYGALYADFADFHLWRISPRAALFVGGYAVTSVVAHDGPSNPLLKQATWAAGALKAVWKSWDPLTLLAKSSEAGQHEVL